LNKPETSKNTVTKKCNEFFNNAFNESGLQIKSQIDLITNSNEFISAEKSKKDYIEFTISYICNKKELSTEELLAELGNLYSFLINDGKFCNFKLINLRIDEIYARANVLLDTHQEICPSKIKHLIPSGCSTYILNEFVKLIFTQNGVFNPGGCHAVKKMVNSKLQLFFSAESCDQINNILDRLLVDKKFLNYLTTYISVDKDLQDLIFFDLKIPKIDKSTDEENPFRFVYAQWAILLALFTPVGQTDEGNCYAVATLFNLLNEHAEILLPILMSVLKKGYLIYGKKKIPVSILLDGKKQYDLSPDFNIKYEKFIQLPIISVLTHCIKSDITDNFDSKINCLLSLDECMQIAFGAKKEIAMKMYDSFYKKNISHLLLSIFQFIPTNTVNGKKESSSKYHLIDFIHLYLLKCIPISQFTKPFIHDFTSKYKSELKERLFIFDYFNSTPNLKNNRINFDFHEKGFKFNGYLEDYKKFKEERRLCILENSKMIPIDSISMLQTHLQRINLSVVNKYFKTMHVDEVIELNSYFSSNEFMYDFSQFLENINWNNTPLKSEEYLDSDSLFLIQRGGNTDYLTIAKPFKTIFKKPVTLISTSVKSFYSNLCHEIFQQMNINSQFLNKDDFLILTTSKRHVYNTFPNRFKKYWKNSPEQKIQHRVFERAAIVSKVTRKQIIDIFHPIIGDYVDVLLKNTNENELLNITSVAVKAKMILPEELLDEVDLAIEKSLDEISLKKVREEASYLLTNVLKNKNEKKYLRIFHETLQGMQILKMDYVTPYFLAVEINKILLQSSPCVQISSNKIENRIRKTFFLPEIIEIGNTNWVGLEAEKKHFLYLAINYSYTKGMLTLSVRDKGKLLPCPLSQDILDETHLYFPKK
jgi:hypothetical protein